MNIVKFSVEGIFNSFRIPFFRTYHKSFLAPPKTTIIGFITNIMGESENYYYKLLNEEKIKVSVVINSIEGKAKDLWSYKTFENKSGMFGRSVIRRDKLFKAKYTIYLKIENKELKDRIVDALNYPKSILSLGLDDEIVKIKNINGNVELAENDSYIINSVFMDKGYEYKVQIDNNDKVVELPTANIIPLNYEISVENNKRMTRKGVEEYKQVEYINCNVQLKNVKSYKCDSDKVVFY